MHHSKHILLIEDNPDDVALTLCAFKRARTELRVEVASDGPEALEYLFGTGRHAGRDTECLPSVILLDVNLPGQPGTELLQQLRADPRTWLIPIIMLTTSREKRDVMDSYRHGANSYICKPVDFQEFTTLIGDLVNYWLDHNELLPAEGGS